MAQYILSLSCSLSLSLSLSLSFSLSLSLPFTQMADRSDAQTVELLLLFLKQVSEDIVPRGFLLLELPCGRTEMCTHTQLLCQVLMALGCLNRWLTPDVPGRIWRSAGSVREIYPRPDHKGCMENGPCNRDTWRAF